MQDYNTSILTKISELIAILPKDWAIDAAAELGVKQGTARAYARGERISNNQHIRLLEVLIKHETKQAKKIQLLTA